MPKLVDREAKRQEIAHAVLRLVAREGLEAASVRQVAAEAGCSTGAVQKYFATKGEMLTAAMDLAGEQMERRWATEPDESIPSGVHDVLRWFLRELLPLDEQRQTAVRIWMAFVTRAAVDTSMRPRVDDLYAAIRNDLAAGIREAQEGGSVRSDLPAESIVDSLIAVVDGLGMRMACYDLGDPRQEALLPVLDTALTALLGPPPAAP